MPHSCAALDCKKRFTVDTRAAGITFHRFPKESSLKKRWVRALRRKGFTPSTASRICSEHFRAEDFDRTGQTVRLREGVVPSVFSFSPHPKKLRPSNTTKTSTEKQERDKVKSFPPALEPEPVPNPDLDHSYALPPSPGDLKAKLNEALERVESLEREMRNAKDRERRAKTALQVLLMDLRGKNIIDDELKQRHVIVLRGLFIRSKLWIKIMSVMEFIIKGTLMLILEHLPCHRCIVCHSSQDRLELYSSSIKAAGGRCINVPSLVFWNPEQHETIYSSVIEISSTAPSAEQQFLPTFANILFGFVYT